MDRKSRVALLVEHFESPRHRGALERADVVVPGGSPDCGGSVTIYLKGNGNGRVEALSWTGQGCAVDLGNGAVRLQ